MYEIIYRDEQREVQADLRGMIRILSGGRQAVPEFQAHPQLKILTGVRPEALATMRARGIDPATYDHLLIIGEGYVHAPKACLAAIAAYAAQREAAVIARAARPAQQERDRIEALFARLEDLRNYPGDFFPAKAEAEKALAAWKRAYPREAALEQAKALDQRAADCERRAGDARTFDADGWLDQSARDANAAALCAEADGIKAEAARLRAMIDAADDGQPPVRG